MTLFPWRVDTHASPIGAWGPSMSEKLNGSKFSCQDQSKHPWKQGKGGPYREVAWLPCGSSAEVFQKLPSDRETLKVLQVLNSSLCHSQKPSPNREKCVFFLLVCVLALI